MTDILQAARSYYGMDSTPVGKCEMYTNEHGSMRLVIEIPVNGSDFIAIGQRMKAMQEVESQSDTVPLDIEMPDMADMRKAYEALSKAEKGRYGSFSNYLRDSSHAIIEARDNAPPAVQRIMDKALEQAEWAMLTDEQKQKQKAKEKP